MCAKYYELIKNIKKIANYKKLFYKKLHLVKVGAFAWYSVKICVIFGVRFERQKVDKKTNLHENWNMQTFFILNISAKSHQNRSL